MKYKIGDKVRITDNKELLEKVGLEPSDLKNEYVGEIVDMDEEWDYPYEIENNKWMATWGFSDEQIIGLVDDEDCCGDCDDKPINDERPSLDYESEYYRALEKILKLELLNNVLLEYISLKDI